MRQGSREKLYPLDEAIWAFASPRLRREYDAAQYTPSDFEVPANSADAPKYLLSGFTRTLDKLGTRSGVWTSMQHSLCQKIKAGMLVAEGVQTMPTLGNGPETIPTFIFDNPRLDSRAVDNFGRRYEGVYIRQQRKPQVQEQSPTSADVEPRPKRRPGRPSKTGYLNAAIDALLNEGADLSSLDRKNASELVLKKAEELGMDMRTGFSPSAVQRALLMKFGER
jgi:hypothetical protein